jgi:rhomboid protease GluP
LKSIFINALIKTLIGSHDFLPAKNIEESINIQDRLSILIKRISKHDIILEIIDADKFTPIEIENKLKKNAEILKEQEKKRGHSIFSIFIFENAPNDEKFYAILNNQYINKKAKKFQNAIGVDLSNTTVKKLYNDSIKDYNIINIIDSLIKEGLKESLRSVTLEELAKGKKNDYAIDYKTKTPKTALYLIGINLVFFVLTYILLFTTEYNLSEIFILLGAKNNVLIRSGEYWRLITPVFLHSGLMHLGFNCYALFILGRTVEKITGRLKFLSIYIAGAIGGSILSLIFSANNGVGASGAIFGLMGSLLFFGVLKPVLFKNYFGRRITTIILFNLFIGFSSPMIDNAAHIGGLIAGFLTAGAVLGLPSENNKWYRTKKTYILALALFIISGLYIGFNAQPF